MKPAHDLLNQRFIDVRCGDLPPAFDANVDGDRAIIERLPDVFELGPGVYRFIADEVPDARIPGRLRKRFIILTLYVELGIPWLTVEELDL